jgi:hypothetical protein
MIYVAGSIVCGLAVPRIEQLYFTIIHLRLVRDIGAGMPFRRRLRHDRADRDRLCHGFVMVQFSAIAYSPRLVLWFARHPRDRLMQ